MAIRGFIASREKPMDIVGVGEGEWLGALAGCGAGGPNDVWVADLIRGREPSAELTVESGHHEYRSVDA